MIYSIKDKLPFNQLLIFSLQLLLSIFVATALIAQICGVAVSGALVGAGLSTIIYLIITGFNSPMFISNSGAFVAPVIAALAIGGYPAVAVGGLTACAVYCIFGLIFTKVPVDKVYNIFPPALIGAITVVIGINLMPFILTYVQVNGTTTMWSISAALVTMFAIAVISHYAKGLARILPFLLGTLVGYAYATILTITGIYPLIDFSIFANLALFNIPDFAFSHWTTVQFSTVLPVIIMYIAFTISAMMECLSDHAALGNIIGVDLYRQPGLHKLFIGEGLANLVGSCIGGLGQCSYGEGVACVGFSRVASTNVTLGAAIMLIILGFLAPVQAFISSIPSCVFAGAAIILYSFIACSGIKMLQKVDLNNNRNLLLAGIPMSLGICGLTVGGSTISFSGTALGLIVGVILNLILKEKSK